MQPDPEHQEDHPQFGQFCRQFKICHVARRERPDHDARQKVPGDKRQFQPLRDKGEQKCQAKASNKGGDQGRFVGQCFTVLSGPFCHLQQGHVRFQEKMSGDKGIVSSDPQITTVRAKAFGHDFDFAGNSL